MRLSKEQWNKIQALKILLTVNVLYMHATNYRIYNLTISNAGKILYWIEIYIQHLNASVVPMFMFLSGYLCYYGLEDKSVFQKIKGRIKRLFMPYVFWGTSAWLFIYILKLIPGIGSRIGFDIGESFKEAILGILVYCSAGSHLWYLRNLIVMVSLMPIIYIVLKKCPAKMRISLAILFLIGLACMQNWDPFGIGILVFDRGVYFALGAIIGAFYNNILWDYFNVIKKYAIILPLIWFVWCLQSNIVFPFEEVRELLGIISIWIMYDIFIKDNKENYWIYETNFFIYCAHYLVLESAEKIVLLLLGNTVVGAAMDYFLVPIIVLAFLLLLARFMSKYTIGLWNFVNGKIL